MAATLPLLDPPRHGRPYGYMAPGRWTKFAGWMRDNGLIAHHAAPAEVLSNDYLPGTIPE